MTKLVCYRVTLSHNRPYWRVDAPDGPVGRLRATFPTEARAKAFFHAARKELKKHKRIHFLTHRDKLVDAQEACLMLEGVPGGKTKLRKAAALYLLCHEEHEKRVGEGAKPFTEPETRGIELQPGLFKALRALARERNIDPNDLAAGVIWQYVKTESEKKIPVVKNEDKIPLRFLL